MKGQYKKILVAVELIPDEDSRVLETARAFAQQFNASLALVHAVENINGYGAASAYPAIVDVEEELLKEHKESLQALANSVGIAAGQQFLEIGSPGVVVAEAAQAVQADLIIVGSHGRHGLALLLGSTADSILHRAECDVLAVRIPNKA